MPDGAPLCATPKRHRMVADAIILERARRVLERRFRAELLLDPAVHAAGEVLRRAAARLRLEAEE